MGSVSAIEWTSATWNPIRGCSRVSEGCRNCYAERTAIRQAKAGQAYSGLVISTRTQGPKWTGEVRFVEEALALPLSWKKPRRIFVNSMSDLFHEKVTDDQLALIFFVMKFAARHTFQVLTKRPERMRAWMSRFDDRWASNELGAMALKAGFKSQRGHVNGDLAPGWPPKNLHLGVSVENRESLSRLRWHVPASVWFASLEPLLEDLGDLSPFLYSDCVGCGTKVTGHSENRLCCPDCEHPRALDWIIVGGESGPGARPCDLAWIRSVVQQAKAAGVPVFVKQLGAVPMMAEWEWKSASDSGAVPLLSALNRDRVPSGFVPIALTDKKGGDMAEWPSLFDDLRVREFPG